MPSSPALITRGYDAAKASDRTLMDRIADGDTEAFDELYRRHSRTVLAQARKLCASRELAEEVAQETFISLWRSARRYRPALGSVSAWLSGIVRNRAIDAWRRTAARPREVPSSEDGPAQLHGLVGADPQAPERSLALSLIAKLPAAQKEAIFLAYFGGMTHDEIATWADAPLGTVKGRIRLGLEKLRGEVEQRPGTPSTRPAQPRPQLRAVPAPVDELEPARRRRAGAVHAPRRGPACPRSEDPVTLTPAA
jgi:RNA polymerase sigma-70 factor (ECF subfamily)